MSIDIHYSSGYERVNKKNITLLIVDGSHSLHKTIFNHFNELNFKTLSAYSIEDAIELLDENIIDYVLLNLHLPDGSGLNVIDKLQNSPTKIFVFNSEQNTHSRDSIVHNNVIDYIYKDKDFSRKLNDVSNTIVQLENNKYTNVLIVEDTQEIQEQLKQILQSRKYNVITTSSIAQAKEALVLNHIHLMLLDIELKDGSGIDFLWKNRYDIVEKRDIPVMMVSNSINQQIMRDALKAGAIDVITKPFIIEEIILKVNMKIEYQRKQSETRSAQVLLNQYKNTVDRSSIVSKTNKKGIITYINDQFCEISGFSRDELIGKNHNIIRHSDMDKKVFKELWHTIKELKMPWQGKVKNIKKDGGFYWVDTLINPILDEYGNITEFIAIRRDITEEMLIQEHFKNELATTNFNFQHALKLSKQYELAINESNILSRASLKGTITYVNDKFCEVSGYKREEAIGRNHSLIRHEDTPNEVFHELWSAITQGKTWKGIIKNKKKNGTTYWVDTTIVPIINNENKITEYMAIRHDISELFELHKEIEDTQKEVIYKMGEIGETRSKETGNHVKRVSEYSRLLAILYGLSEHKANILFTASPMHDIGKVGISDEILKKPSRLTDEEFEIMKTHVDIGHNILKGSKREVLQAASIVAYEHHERWDGKGYPLGLKEEEIHIFGRITALADVFDALGSERCYKEIWDDERIFALLKEESGNQFDPDLIKLFFENFEKFDEIRQKHKDL